MFKASKFSGTLRLCYCSRLQGSPKWSSSSHSTLAVADPRGVLEAPIFSKAVVTSLQWSSRSLHFSHGSLALADFVPCSKYQCSLKPLRRLWRHASETRVCLPSEAQHPWTHVRSPSNWLARVSLSWNCLLRQRCWSVWGPRCQPSRHIHAFKQIRGDAQKLITSVYPCQY